MGDNAHKGNSHRSPLPFSKCLSQPPVHGKFTNRLLPPYWKRWSLYGRLIMRIEYLSDKLWLEVTPCIVPVMPGLALRVGGIGAAPDYGEVVSKSFLLAHRPDWWLVGLCAFSFLWSVFLGIPLLCKQWYLKSSGFQSSGLSWTFHVCKYIKRRWTWWSTRSRVFLWLTKTLWKHCFQYTRLPAIVRAVELEYAMVRAV